MKKLLAVLMMSVFLMVGCGGGGGSSSNPSGSETKNLIIDESFLLGKKWYVIRGTSSQDKTKEVEVVLKKGTPSNILSYEFYSNKKVKRTTILVDENLEFAYGTTKEAEYHITDGILYVAFENSLGIEDRKGIRVNDEIKLEYNSGSSVGHYSILSTNEPKVETSNK